MLGTQNRAARRRPPGVNQSNTGSPLYLTNTDMLTLTVWPPGP